MVILIIVVFGFLYGKDYFKFCEEYGMLDSAFSSGVYILALKWWNIKFNWYTRFDQWQVDVSVIFPISLKKRKFREYVIIVTSTGVKTCTVDIN